MVRLMAIEFEDQTDPDHETDTEEIDEATAMLTGYIHGSIQQVIALDGFPALRGSILAVAVANALQEVLSDYTDSFKTQGYLLVKKP
jgi:hypothetical protein